MAKVTSFELNKETMDMKLYKGDTASFLIHAKKKGGSDWTEDDRMLFTVKNPNGGIVMQRIYRLDDQYDLGDGYVLIEFHNDDTDSWDTGSYDVELRFDFPPIWDGTPSTARCVNALSPGTAKMVEGGNVKTVIQATLEIKNVKGDI